MSLSKIGAALGISKRLADWASRMGAALAAHGLTDPFVRLYDEGPDLVLYYKHLMVLEGHAAYAAQINPTDALSDSQRAFLEAQWRQFRTWWNASPGRDG